MTNKQLQKLVKKHFDYDGVHLIWKIPTSNSVKIGQGFGYVHPTGYIIGSFYGKPWYEHRLIYLMHHGELPEMLDHIDRNRSNNAIENLRPATRSHNSLNRSKRKGASSKYRGVCWDTNAGKWIVQSRINGQKEYLGRFTNELEAAKAYDSYVKSNAPKSDLLFIQLNFQ